MADGTLIFDTKIDLTEFEKGVKNLKTAGENAAKSVGESIGEKLTKSVAKSEKATQELTDSIEEVENKTKKYKKTILDTSNSIEKADNQTDEYSKTLDKMSDSMSGVEKNSRTVGDVIKGVLGASLIQNGMNMLVDFGKKSIMLASDLQEVQNVVDVTFGEGAADINAFAKEASEAFGLTELQAKQFTGTIGAMVKSMGLSEAEAKDMAISMTGLVGDMASFYNLDHETAFEKIRSGLSGETEPLKQLGINMSVANLEAYRLSKGIKTAYDSMTEAERVQLRYSFIMDQTSDAQGDFTRTQDGFANQMRILSNNFDTLAATIGSKFIPLATSGVSAINNLLSGVLGGESEESPIVKELNSAIESLEELDGLVDQTKQDFTRNVIKINVDYNEAQGLIETLDELQKQRGEDGNIDLGTVNLRLGDAGTEVSNLQEALRELGYMITDALISGSTEQLKEVTDQLVELYPELEQYVGEDGVLSLEADKVRELTEAYKELAIQKAFQTKIETLGEGYAEGAVNLEVTKQKVKEAKDEQEELSGDLETLLCLQDDINQNADKLSGANLRQYNSWAEAFSSEDVDVGKTVDQLNAYFEAIGGIPTETIDKLSKSGIDLGSILNLDDGSLDISKIEGNEEALKALAELLNTVSGEQIHTEIQAKQAELDAINASIAEAETQMQEAQTSLEEIQTEIELTKQAQETFMQELETKSAESGEKAGKSVGEKTASGIKKSKGTAEKEFSNLLRGIQSKAKNNPVSIPVKFSVPSLPKFGRGSATGHATGLYRVPYDNYYARLHAGERVLTAAEAREYNRAESASAGLPQEPIIIEQPAQTIVVDIGGYRFAEAQVESNRIALNNLSKKIAQGRGHR